MSKWKDEIKSPTTQQQGSGEPSHPNYIIQPKNSPNFTYDNIETLISAYVEPATSKVELGSLETVGKFDREYFRKFNFGPKSYFQKLTSFWNNGADKSKITTIECNVYEKPVDQVKEEPGTSKDPGKELQKTFTLPRVEIIKSSSGTNTPEVATTTTTTTIATTVTPTPPSTTVTTKTAAVAPTNGSNYNDDTGFIKPGRQRISSSHYSTEKSGSSGYYGSNLYSTSSVSVIEENIYSEPVIESKKGEAITPASNDLAKTKNVRLDFVLDAPTKGVRSTKHKEIECLESLKQSISNLENCLQNQQSESLPVMTGHQEHMYSMMDGDTSSSDGQIPRPIWPNYQDDELLTDINLDEFLLKNETSRKEQQRLTGMVNPIFERSSSDDDMQRSQVVNVGDQAKGTRVTSQYEELISFHRTRDILEQIRGKLNGLLQQYTESAAKQHSLNNPYWPHAGVPPNDDELESNIVNLRNDLDNYLKIMNDQSENDIRAFCDGLSRNTKRLTLHNALTNKTNSVRGGVGGSICGAYYSENEYEICDNGSVCTKYHTSLRMPRDSFVTDDGFTLAYDDKINPFMHLRDGREKCKRTGPLFPVRAHHYENCDVKCKQCEAVAANVKKGAGGRRRPSGSGGSHCCCVKTGVDDGNVYINDLNQMQENLSIQGIMLMNSLTKKSNSDKEKILHDYHKNKPSIWELYYGANRTTRPHQTLIRKIKLGGKNALSISYPSTRPESDFTLDVPRAEQLKIKMEQEKQFRHRCRITIYLLSLIVFLAIVMIVSLILTRGKRMFGSMI